MVKIKHIVIKPFNNLGAVVMPGDTVECDPGRASKLRRLGLIGGAIKEDEKAAALSFKVTYFDDFGKEVIQAVEAGSYQQAVDKVIKDLFAELEMEPTSVKKAIAPKAKAKAVK